MSNPASNQIAIIGIDIGKELVPCRWPRQARRDCPAAEMVAWPG